MIPRTLTKLSLMRARVNQDRRAQHKCDSFRYWKQRGKPSSASHMEPKVSACQKMKKRIMKRERKRRKKMIHATLTTTCPQCAKGHNTISPDGHCGQESKMSQNLIAHLGGTSVLGALIPLHCVLQVKRVLAREPSHCAEGLAKRGLSSEAERCIHVERLGNRRSSAVSAHKFFVLTGTWIKEHRTKEPFVFLCLFLVLELKAGQPWLCFCPLDFFDFQQSRKRSSRKTDRESQRPVKYISSSHMCADSAIGQFAWWFSWHWR